MSVEDGYMLIRKVRALFAAQSGMIPAIALTAYGSFGHRMRALEAGFQTYAIKPVEPDELIGAIRGLIKNFTPKAA
jgi:DNA-binding response OmpR family regulator